MVNSSPARHIVVIPAAGAGSRMGAKTPKQYQPIAGRSMLEQTIGIFAGHPRIDEVWVLLAPADPMQLPACKLLRCGGETRALTVLHGLRQIPAQPHDWVLVHDAARPCLSRSALDRLLDTLRHEQVGGLLAVPVADTLKKANADQDVAATVDRTGLWQAQTPQMFRYGLLMQALQAMTDATDEAQAVECLGYMPRLVPGERSNIKVTYPEDLLLAALILQGKSV